MTERRHHWGLSHRARIALATMFAWLLALEVLPNLHLATHDESAHHHDAYGAIVFDGPAHGHSHAPAKQKKRGSGWNAPADHGANSYAHRTAAIQPPGVPILAPLPVDVVATYLVVTEPGQLHSIAAARPRARGPPSLIA